MEKEKIKEVIENSNTIYECLLKLGKNTSSGSYKIFNKKVKEYDIDISHFLSKSENMKKRWENGELKSYSNDEMFIKNSTISRNVVKSRIIKENLIPYICNKCGSDNIWNGEKITLILDHINGINNDHRIKNLRFLCPNCNSTLKTHCVGNKGLKEKIDKRTIRTERLSTRKVKNRPTKNKLIELLKNNSYVKIGKQYGVSDNAVRKWAKKYELI